MNLKFRLKLRPFLFLPIFSLILAACGYPTPDRTTGLTPFVVVVTPTPATLATPTVASTTAPATTRIATTSAASTTAAPATTEQNSASTYTVKEGDTLLAIANKLGVDVRELQKINDIEDPSKLQIDAVLKIPPKKTTNPTPKP